MAFDPYTATIDLINGVGSKLIDRLFPDKEKQAVERAQAELTLIQVQNDQDIKLMQAAMAAILAEANSSDPWTSRARPSFLYVIYVMILWSLPMGILSAFNPTMAAAIAQGMKEWLAAIPDALWGLFGAGYLGYTAAHSYDKKKKLEMQ